MVDYGQLKTHTQKKQFFPTLLFEKQKKKYHKSQETTQPQFKK